MKLAELSIKRPYFISCIVVLSVILGILSLKKLSVDLFPDVNFPIILVTTVYPGAGPQEIETQVSRVLEDEMSSLSGVKSVRSQSKEGVGIVIVEFTLETDIKYAEQQVRDRVSKAKIKLPTDIKEPIIRRIDPAEQPIVVISLSAPKLSEGKLYELADTVLRPKIEQVSQVGLVEILGGRKREIKVELDKNKLKQYEIPASLVVQRLMNAGQNIPAGKVAQGSSETLFRTLGDFQNLEQIEKTVVNFAGNDVPIVVGQLGQVKDSLEDEASRVYLNGNKAVTLMVFRQSGANTMRVVEDVKKKVLKINDEFKKQGQDFQVTIARDQSKPIKANVDDVVESILFGIFLTVLVVFVFLGNARSTVITGLALPNSILGAFILMAAFGFTINVMTLLALSLAVGLLIDDAIVVRENIFRHREMGKSPKEASIIGTTEVSLAVIATTLTVVAVFGPVAFLQGVVGQFFKQFGLVVCFTMLISLFDALTIAPMLSTYFGGAIAHAKHKTRGLLAIFEKFQTGADHLYERVLKLSLKSPILTLVGAFLIFVSSLVVAKFVPKTFLSPQDTGEFSVGLDLPPGTSLSAMGTLALEVDQLIRANKEVASTILTVGNRDGESNVAEFYVQLVDRKKRVGNTSQFKDKLRAQLVPFAYANPKVKDIDMVGGGRPFNLNLTGPDLVKLEEIGKAVFQKLKDHPGLKDADSSFRPGKPEYQVIVDDRKADQLGIMSSNVGRELRILVEGMKAGVFREAGEEYDIRVRLQEDQRDIKNKLTTLFVPNVNNSLIRLSSIAKSVDTKGTSTIYRQDRARYVQISADITPNGPGLGGVMTDIASMFENDIKLPPGFGYRFVGQAENFAELVTSMVLAAVLSICFIYLVLVSLYESVLTPLTILLVLPLAACGAFFALFITRQSLDLFSMIGCILLIGIATKNSILLVDAIKQAQAEGMDRIDAIFKAARTRLRPILMTSFALIAGMLPVAIGLNEASKQRTSMGISVIGGLISSTLLTLVVVPCAFIYIDRFGKWAKEKLSGKREPAPSPAKPTNLPLSELNS